ncbi:hypothetical protein LIER_15374 [Lithospermum erythrorhizon]|uniref:Uncharacterized protein n=1 Tax=Lithospermum erythrorhizon TaxID=34254 RepID=A0AAV3Q4I5_LITER
MSLGKQEEEMEYGPHIVGDPQCLQSRRVSDRAGNKASYTQDPGIGVEVEGQGSVFVQKVVKVTGVTESLHVMLGHEIEKAILPCTVEEGYKEMRISGGHAGEKARCVKSMNGYPSVGGKLGMEGPHQRQDSSYERVKREAQAIHQGHEKNDSHSRRRGGGPFSVLRQPHYHLWGNVETSPK